MLVYMRAWGVSVREWGAEGGNSAGGGRQRERDIMGRSECEYAHDCRRQRTALGVFLNSSFSLVFEEV